MRSNKFVVNVMWLTLLQGINFFAPLIALPYLVRVLGVTDYGLYIFVGVMISYFGLVCDYGFNLTGTRDISLNKNNKDKVQLIFSKIIIIKTVALIITTFIFILLSIYSKHVQENFILYICTFSLLLGQTYFPAWFFQGIEDFKLIAILNCVSRTIFTIMIFITVKQPSDAYLVALMNSLGTLTVTIMALFIITYKYKIRIIKVDMNSVMSYAKKSFFVFMAQMKISLFSSANIVILGLISGPTAVGYFSAAEKLMRALAQIQIPLLSALFPKMSYELKNHNEKSIRLIKKILIAGTVFYALVCGLFFIAAESIIKVLFGEQFGPSVLPLQIILICPLLIFQNNIFGTQLLLNLGKEKIYLLVVSVTGIINLILAFILTEKYNFIGTSISLLISEICVVLGMFYFSKDYIFKKM